MSEQEPVGIAIIGAGGYGKSLARAASESQRIRLISCYDPVKEAADQLAAKYQCRSVSLEEILLDDSVEGVVICSPNNAHRQNAVAAANAGKHVFVDKPISNTIEDALAIIAACESANVVLSVGHNGRRLDGHRQMKSMIASGAVGEPITVEANFSHSGGLGLTGKEWRASREECPGLPLMQLGIHFADTMQYLLGDVIEVSSFMTRLATRADNDDVTVSILRFESGLLGYLGSNYATPSIYYVNVYGTGGNLLCEGGSALKYRRAGESTYEPVATRPRDTQIEELEEFAECIRSGARPEVDGEAALKALAVVRAALESNRTGRSVRIAELLSRPDMSSPAT